MDLLETELYPQYGPKFERLGYTFRTELERAYHTATTYHGAETPDDIKKEVITVLKMLLKHYRPKRKSGKWFKAIATGALKIWTILKFKKK